MTFRPYQSADRRWVIVSNSRHYQQSEGFNASFRDAVTEAMAGLEGQISDPGSQFTIVEGMHGRIGCIFFSPEGDAAGRIRLFYLRREYRGRGIGRRMLSNVIDFARHSGFAKIRVSTFDRHHEACALYNSLGFVGAVHAPAFLFGQNMSQIDFELML